LKFSWKHNLLPIIQTEEDLAMAKSPPLATSSLQTSSAGDQVRGLCLRITHDFYLVIYLQRPPQMSSGGTSTQGAPQDQLQEARQRVQGARERLGAEEGRRRPAEERQRHAF